MILIYTGNGKGKTSASVGQTIRALGAGLSVAFCQFMKRDEKAGEQIMLKKLLNSDFYAGGLGFFRNKEELPAHREAALRTLAWATDHLKKTELIVMDEILYALHAELVLEDELESFLTTAKKLKRHVVLSGRNVPDWLAKQADLITEMGEVKHHFAAGVKAQKGIEF